ncbi:hypothetical protein EJ02DRAFT_508816 [Clathrospora elynae]|uniref:Apple domain-containing protein n=1 Tax=Clathrospora elynae TaxID=706981 RepID=A0A6A5T3K7_9PLEO|nr:hypothetical protein EJ02DRAFT_508816 [Clathrospora elynae]
MTCTGSGFGHCCNFYSYCGSDSDYCKRPGCQPEFGVCDDFDPSTQKWPFESSSTQNQSSTSSSIQQHIATSSSVQQNAAASGSQISSTTAAAPTPSSRVLTCGIAGVLNIFSRFKPHESIDLSSDQKDAGPCAAACLKDEDCQAYSYNHNWKNSSKMECRWYPDSLADYGFAPINVSPNLYYERECATVSGLPSNSSSRNPAL